MAPSTAFLIQFLLFDYTFVFKCFSIIGLYVPFLMLFVYFVHNSRIVDVELRGVMYGKLSHYSHFCY